MSDVCAQKDMVGRKVGYLIWGAPIGLVLIGAVLDPAARTLLWTPAFLVMGGACAINATRCGRLHCFFTGPLYLLAALASLLVGLEIVAMNWGWIGYGALIGTVLAYVPEWIRGRYARATCRMISHRIDSISA